MVKHLLFDLGGVLVKTNSNLYPTEKEIRAKLYTGELERIDDGYKKTILDWHWKNLERILELREKFPISILSNTSFQHIEVFEKMFIDKQTIALERYFRLFYSCRIGLKKPDTKIYEFVVEQLGIKPSQILFFDDKQENVEGAAACGFKTWLVKDFNIKDGLREHKII